MVKTRKSQVIKAMAVSTDILAVQLAKNSDFKA
jgi:hypothetical protein